MNKLEHMTANDLFEMAENLPRRSFVGKLFHVEGKVSRLYFDNLWNWSRGTFEHVHLNDIVMILKCRYVDTAYGVDLKILHKKESFWITVAL